MNPYISDNIQSRKIIINGPVLLLMGPIGSFFSRLSNYLELNNIDVFKISFPLYEFGFSKKNRIYFNKDMAQFKSFLLNVIKYKKIKHIFMYGDFIIPHQIAIDLAKELRNQGIEIESEVFELGYLRPNYVTLEPNGVNCRSNLIHSNDFYYSLPEIENFPVAKVDIQYRWRKIWKLIIFIQHSFVNFKISNKPHKLQPKPIYLIYQLRGFIRKFIYIFSEKNIRKTLKRGKPFFLIILQVETDSQMGEGSPFNSIEDFIKYVIDSFANSGIEDVNLIFKHHPRDRGYTNYRKLISSISSDFGISHRVFYFHDSPLSPIFRNINCRGVVLINSSVGYQALFHNVPVKSLGVTPYNIEGLADQKHLNDFWANPQSVDSVLYKRFYRYVLEKSQINGNFDGYFPFEDIFIFN